MIDALKLTAYLGERDRSERRLLADALMALFADAGVRTSVLLRGAAGFGVRHRLQTDRLLTLSEDLPLVAVAVDERARIEAIAERAAALMRHGTLTLERARMLVSGEEAAVAHEAAKLTLYLGRHARLGGRPAYEAAVAMLRDRGLAGATVLLGVDGTAGGERRRARFFAGNADVPLMVISVGDGGRVVAAAAEVMALLPDAAATVERVTLLRRDGTRLGGLPDVAADGDDGRPLWLKVSVFATEHERLLLGLRETGALGATALRGVWGYSGDHAPHGDRFGALRRRVPMVTVAVDSPPRVARWLPAVEAATAQAGLVTAEIVPTARMPGASAGQDPRP